MTLTQTAVLVKRAIIFSVIAIVLSLTSFIGYKIWYAYYLANLPPVEEKPDTKFGILPPPGFPEAAVSSSNFTYSLDTTTGGLPKVGQDPGFEKIIKVYFVSQSFATFLSPDRSQVLAEKFGLSVQPEILSQTNYKFSNKEKSLLVNLDNGNFTYNSEAAMSGKFELNDDNRIISDFEQILSTLGVLKEDLKNGRKRVTYLKRLGTGFTPTEIRPEAQAAQISLWPAPIDNKSIFTPDFNQSLVNALVAGQTNSIDDYLSINFTYYPVDRSTFATYPLKTAEVAFDDLKNGKGIVVIEPDKPQVSITSVSLGYYLPENYSPYLQPIFIFEGPSFVAYVSAITEQFQSEGH